MNQLGRVPWNDGLNDGLTDGLDEAATRRSRLLRHHELFCTFIPSNPRE